MAANIALLAAEEESHNPLLPATYDIVWSIVCLVIVGFVFWKYVLPMFQKVLAERTEQIDGGIKRADRPRPKRRRRSSSTALSWPKLAPRLRRSVRTRAPRGSRSSPK